MALLKEWPRVDQIALLTPDLHSTMNACLATLGTRFRVFEVDETNSSFSGSSASFRTRIAVALAGFTSVEIIQPVSGVTIHSEHLRTRGPGLHHVGIHADDFTEAVESFGSRGYKKLMEGRIDLLGQFAYFEAHDMNCIIEPLHLSIEFPLFLAKKARPYP